MNSSKLFQIIQNFSKKEIREAFELIPSSLLGGDAKHLLCFEYHTKLKNEKISKEDLYKLCFGQKPFNEVNLRLLLSETTKLLEKFIAMKMALSDKDFMANASLVRAKAKGNEKLFTQLLKKDKKRISQNDVKNDAYFDQINFLFLEEYDFNNTKSRNHDFHLQEMLDALEHKQAIEMMRICCLCISHGIVSGIKFNLAYIERNISFFNENKFDSNKTLKLFLLCFNILTLPYDNETFEQLNEKLSNGINEIEHRDAKIIYTIIINFCIRQFNFGNITYGEKTILLYTSGIENKYLLNQGFISRYTYRNLITLALRTNKIDLARSVCESYQALLNTKERSSSYEFAMAQIDYVLENYYSAQSRLTKVSFDDHLLNLAAKTMLIKIFYITKELDLLSFHIDAMRMYIMRKKVIGYHKENYINIISTMKKLMKAVSLDNSQKKSLADQINTITPLTEKNWFLQQLS